MKRKQLALNIAANGLSVLVSLAVSFLLTPYIVENIGKEAYSFVPISNNFVQYMTILTVAMTSMTARFVTLSLHRGNQEKASAYYSTSFFTNLAIATVAMIFGILIVFTIDRFIDIPSPILTDVRLLFFFMFVMFFVNVTTNTFSVPAFSVNRIDLTGLVTILSILTRLTIIVIAFVFFPPHVYYIGLSILGYMIIQGAMNFYFARKLLPELKIRRKQFNFSLAKELGSSGIWSTFNQLSTVLLTGLDLVIANVALGASAAGILAVAKTAPMALGMVVNVVPQAFFPHLTILYAQTDKTAFFQELRYSLKVSALLTGIPIAGFIALASAFFRLWVPSVPQNEVVLLSLLTMGSMVANFGLMPLLYVFTITNKLKFASLSVFLSGILNLVIVLILLKTTSLGLIAVAGVSSVLEAIRFLVFVPLYTSHVLHIKPRELYPSILRGLVYISLLILTYFGLSTLWTIHSWIDLGILASVLTLIGLGIGWIIMLNKGDRQRIVMMIKPKLTKN